MTTSRPRRDGSDSFQHRPLWDGTNGSGLALIGRARLIPRRVGLDREVLVDAFDADGVASQLDRLGPEGLDRASKGGGAVLELQVDLGVVEVLVPVQTAIDPRL